MGASDPARQDAAWASYVRSLRAPGSSCLPPPFEEQWKVYQETFAGRAPEGGPPVAWRPEAPVVERSNLAQFWRAWGLTGYAALHAASVRDRPRFWVDAVRRLGVAFQKEPGSPIDLSGGVADPRWFPGAVLNAAESCFQAPPGQVAIVAGSEEDSALTRVTYGELDALAHRVAGGLRALGFAPGDRVALYMPMTVECVACYLGIVRAGLAVVSIADSFQPPEVARRVEIAQAKGIVTLARYRWGGKAIDLYAKVREAGVPKAIVIPEGRERLDLRSGDVGWEAFLDAAAPAAAPFPADAYAVTNVLFSSGTTGDPKAIPWTHLTPLKCAVDGHFHQDIHPEDVVAWPTNVGWMMGPWLIYASLVNRAGMALYVGAPGGRGFAEFVERAGVTVLGTVPSLVRAWREGEALAGADWRGVRLFSSTGEASNVQDYLWLMSQTRYRAPVIEYCGGTEIGGGHITGAVAQAASPATFTTPALGIDLVILDEAGRPVTDGGMGELFVVPPSVGLSQELLNRDHREIYYAGCPRGPSGEVLRRHGDQVQKLARGFYKALGRADDTMNLGGIKVSAYELEQVFARHPGVYEAAAVAVQLGGEGVDRLVAYVVPRGDARPDTLKVGLQKLLSSELNPLFKLHDVVPVGKLPRTASNKLMRRELRKAYLEGRR